MKHILIIGGTYFAGRILTMMASPAGWKLTLINRGRYSMTHFPNVEEFHLDRRDRAALGRLPPQDYDAAVDLCGYEPGDVRTVLETLPGQIGQYVFISTCDVYARSDGRQRDEDSPLVTARPDGPAGAYLYKKALLEQETRDACSGRGIPCSILRPAFLYRGVDKGA